MIKQKYCVVTGGANGIGRCLVQEFDKKGYHVAFIDFDKINGEKVLTSLENSENKSFFFHGDVSKQEDIETFAKKVIANFSAVDIVVNNACYSNQGILSDCSYESFNEVLRVGITAPYMFAKLFLNHFNENASIINISSTRAFMSQKDTESYSAAKGGITALTHALAVSLAGKVRVNCISPGWIDTGFYHDESYIPNYSKADTEQHLSKRVGNPLDIANAVLFLCKDESKFINGQNIIIDGGMTKLMIYHGDEGWSLNT
jgi:NAD(P)-dependent dehydrogenase (short-subunit alcohol dehydrogenase family)